MTSVAVIRISFSIFLSLFFRQFAFKCPFFPHLKHAPWTFFPHLTYSYLFLNFLGLRLIDGVCEVWTIMRSPVVPSLLLFKERYHRNFFATVSKSYLQAKGPKVFFFFFLKINPNIFIFTSHLSLFIIIQIKKSL